MSEYITIKEFAERAGVSTQAIYQRLAKDLKPYLQVEKGKRTININALQLFNNKNLKQVDCKENLNLQSEIFEKMLDTLREQLAEKDKQLQAAAAEKAELLARLRDAQQAEQQAHFLHAGTMQKEAERLEIRAETLEPEPENKKKKRSWKVWNR